MTQSSPESPLLTKEEAARYLRIPLATLNYWHCAKKGPAFIKIGRHVFYHRNDLDAYIEQNRIDHGSARA